MIDNPFVYVNVNINAIFATVAAFVQTLIRGARPRWQKKTKKQKISKGKWS